jgi:hypothetical protein
MKGRKKKEHGNLNELVNLFSLHVFCVHVCVTLFPLGFASGSINMCNICFKMIVWIVW